MPACARVAGAAQVCAPGGRAHNDVSTRTGPVSPSWCLASRVRRPRLRARAAAWGDSQARSVRLTRTRGALASVPGRGLSQLVSLSP